MEAEPRASTSKGVRSRLFYLPHVENSSDSEEISDEEITEVGQFDRQHLLSRRGRSSVCLHRGRRKQMRKKEVTCSQNSIPHEPAKRVLTKKKVPRALQRLRNPSDSEGNDDNEKVDGSEPGHSVGKWRFRKRRIPLEESNTRKKIARSQDGRRKQIRNEHISWSQSSSLDVRCGSAEGVLYKEKLARGISEKSIQSSDGKWFTPAEFETKGGRGSCKSWKRTIFCNGITLEKLITSGVLPNPPRKYGRRKKRENTQQTPHSVSWKKKMQRRYHQSSSSGTRTSPKAGQKESTAAENDKEPQEDVTAVSMPSSSASSPMPAVACSNSNIV